jgi:hypothetical protein
MKRISLCAALLAFVPGLAQAYYGYCEGVHYSPYALSYYHSGLVGPDVEYTPYALSYYNSGLVPGYGVYPGWCLDYGYPVFSTGFRSTTHIALHASAPMRRHAQAISRPAHPRPGPCQANGPAQPHAAPPCRADGMDVIRQHLRTRGFASVSIDRILRVDNQLVSVDVFVKDRNLLIKYWNPAEVANLSTKDVSKQRVYAQYKQNWEQFAEQYKQTGGEVYTINASEPQTIVAALDSCTRLSPDNGVIGQPVLYAKN